MPDSEFGSLGERLLRAGIAPRHARRLLDELTTHYALLVEEETDLGQPLEAARSCARIRLGTDDEILARASQQAMLRSWGARWPLVCVIVPLVALAGSGVLLIAALAAVFSTLGPPGEPEGWLRGATMLVGWTMMYGLPLLWAYILARYSVSRRLRWRWPLTGLALAAAGGALTNFRVIWPGRGVRGALSAGVGWIPDHALSFVTRSLVTLAFGMALYVLLRARLGQRTTA